MRASLGAFREYFGEDAVRVCASLASARRRSLRQLCVDTKLPTARCAKILHALLRHGCVKPCVRGQWITAQTYHLNADSVLQISRAHLFLQHVRQKVGQAAARVSLCLLLRGSLTEGEVDELLGSLRASAIQTPCAKNTLVDMRKAGIAIATTGDAKLRQISVLSQNPESTATSRKTEITLWHLDVLNVSRMICEDESASFQLAETRNAECQAAEHTASQRACISSSLLLGNLNNVEITHLARANAFSPNGQTGWGSPSSISGATNQHALKSEYEMNTLHAQLAQTVVRRRFGEHACRIFRLLCRNPQLEQKQISEVSMIPLKDCRDILGKLLKHEYVRMQEVARTTDHAPSRTNYLWKVHLPSVVVRMNRELENTLVHLKNRLDHEVRREQDRLRVAASKLTCKVRKSCAPRGRSSSVEKIATSILRVEKMMLIFTS